MVKQLQNCKSEIKPWGNEIIWAEGKDYVGKYLLIQPGKRLSLQYHEEKEETIFVMLGELILWESEDESKFRVLKQNDVFHVHPKQVHRFGAKAGDQPVILMEVSSNHLGDVVRIKDDYER